MKIYLHDAYGSTGRRNINACKSTFDGRNPTLSKKIRAAISSVISIFLILLFILTFLINIHCLKSGSMSPAYPEGSVIISTPLKTPELGDVCAYRHNGMTVVHRIVGISSEGFIFKGDANNVTDPEPVSIDDIEGVMLFGIPVRHNEGQI